MRVQMLSCVFWIVLLFLFGIDYRFVTGQCLKNQKELLLQFRNNLTYDSSLSNNLVRWDESIDCCRWGGVKCDSRGRVTGLDLSSESISDGIGNANNSLFRLEFLQSLNLAQNSFDSIQLPSGLGKLSGLGYLNLSSSGFSGQIPLEYSNLTRLVVLDLSTSISSSVVVENPDLKTLIHNFTRLQELYLDGVNISAEGYDWCNAISSSLPDLRVLSLSNAYLRGPFNPSLAKLQFLSIIHLDAITFSSPFPQFFANFSNLRVLTISSCDLSGVVPGELFRIPSLQTIDLSGNRGLQGALPEFPPNGSLQNLLLSYTNFSGNIPESIGSLRMLSQLDLRGCNFSGRIPNSFTNLTRLVYLDLSINHFIGPVPSFALLKNLKVINLDQNGLTGRIPDSLWEGLENLNFLSLSGNSLEGESPASLFRLPSLKVLDVNNNRFYGSIRGSINLSLSLESLDLSNNNLEGPIPQFIFELHNLSTLTLSGNKFNGSVDLYHFQRLTELVNLDLSHNNLFIHISENVSIPSLFPRLGSLMLASCKLQKLPLLRNQPSLKMLDLSDNQLKGEIPNWMWDMGDGSLRFLNLSHNQFSTLQEPYHIHGLDYFDLHSNMLGGEIPLPPPSAVYVELSSNNFSSSIPANIGNFLPRARLFSIGNNKIIGTIPPSLCNASLLEILDLSNNSLHGRIPSCLVKDTLSVLNVGRNNLTGEIPDTFPLSCGLQTLDLSWNTFHGKIPRSLASCKEIEVMNLGHNKLHDAFPCWFKNFTKLRVLVLSFNDFYGNTSCLGHDYSWANLQILSLASNSFNSVLSSNLFRNLKAMAVNENESESQLDYLHFVSVSVNEVYYQDSVTVSLKGQDYELEKILTVFTSIDFSNNRFTGTIPQTVGGLISLYILNLSHNALSGQIPASLGNLQHLESLDLSFNNLGGEIPSQLAGLTFLSFLNLSHNQLVGRIPQGNQLQTFSESSFLGNEGLCGFPLNKTCGNSTTPADPNPESEEKERTLESEIYVSAALGFLVGVGVIFVPILLSRRWKMLYDKHTDKFVLSILQQKEHKLDYTAWSEPLASQVESSTGNSTKKLIN